MSERKDAKTRRNYLVKCSCPNCSRIQNTASAESKKVRNSFAPTAINSFSPHHDPLHNFLLPDADCRA
jgi:hypothetical protein